MKPSSESEGEVVYKLSRIGLSVQRNISEARIRFPEQSPSSPITIARYHDMFCNGYNDVNARNDGQRLLKWIV